MRSSSLGTAMFALVAISSVARAQSQSQIDSLRLRNDCRLAQQVVETGDPAPKTEWAYGIIHLCPQAGGALARAWSLALVDDALQYRERQSTTVSDARILQAALAVAADAGRNMAERRSALEVVTQLYRPGRTLSGIWSDVHAHYVTLGAVFDRDVVAGAQPIGDADRAAALTALDRIVSTEPESDIGVASRFLVRELRRPLQ